MRIFKLWSDNKTQRRSAFRSNRCSRWLKAYDRGSTVVYKFFAYRWFQSWEMFLIFRFSWSILWSFAVTVFSGLFSDNDGDERPMLSLLSRGSLLWMNLGGTSFQFPSSSHRIIGNPVNIHLLLAVRLNLELIMKICRRVWSVDGCKGIKLTGF